MRNKNAKLLESFNEYCRKHPEQRFWQALRNWAGVPFVYICDDKDGVVDTFYFEKKLD